MGELANIVELPWLVVGDYNAYTSVNEKKGSNFHDYNSMDAFNLCLNQCGLIDLGFSALEANLLGLKEE